MKDEAGRAALEGTLAAGLSLSAGFPCGGGAQVAEPGFSHLERPGRRAANELLRKLPRAAANPRARGQLVCLSSATHPFVLERIIISHPTPGFKVNLVG